MGTASLRQWGRLLTMWEAIVLALIGSVSAISVALIQRPGRKMVKSVATSNGQTIGELVEELAVGQKVQRDLLAEHTAQDEANFRTMRARLDYLAKELS